LVALLSKLSRAIDLLEHPYLPQSFWSVKYCLIGNITQIYNMEDQWPRSFRLKVDLTFVWIVGKDTMR
jgi:hypothetical protein